MSIIPVLDLMIGQIVLAQGGQRDAYRPVHSRLTHSSRPLDVARAMFGQTGCDCFYVADIDSFAGAAPNWSVVNELLDHGFRLWLDADWIGHQRFHELSEVVNDPDRVRPIVSSETLTDLDQLSVIESLSEAGLDPIFSLDRKGDSMIVRGPQDDVPPPLEWVRAAYQRGVREMIVLDLEAVGTREGFQLGHAATSLVEELRSELPEMRLTSGGGVRNAADVARWLELGCDHVLVASAIHDCAFTPDDIAHLQR